MSRDALYKLMCDQFDRYNYNERIKGTNTTQVWGEKMDDKPKHMPEGKWEFDDEVTNIFDDMLERSIPQYQVMRNSVKDLALHFTNEYTSGQITVLDLGCSRGEAIAGLVQALPNARFFGWDISDPMIAVAKKRFKYDDNVKIAKKDLRTVHGYDYPDTNIVLAILSLQFTPIDYRQDIIQNIYNSLRGNGCFIMVEKVLGNSSILSKEFIHQYHSMKAKNGYSQEEIDRKKLSLEGVLVPTTAKWNEDLLKQAGFRYVDCFWRWMNFAGWIAVK